MSVRSTVIVSSAGGFVPAASAAAGSAQSSSSAVSAVAAALPVVQQSAGLTGLAPTAVSPQFQLPVSTDGIIDLTTDEGQRILAEDTNPDVENNPRRASNMMRIFRHHPNAQFRISLKDLRILERQETSCRSGLDTRCFRHDGPIHSREDVAKAIITFLRSDSRFSESFQVGPLTLTRADLINIDVARRVHIHFHGSEGQIEAILARIDEIVDSRREAQERAAAATTISAPASVPVQETSFLQKVLAFFGMDFTSFLLTLLSLKARPVSGS